MDAPILMRLKYSCVRNAHIMERSLVRFQPVHFLVDQMRLELPGTPADTDAGPAIPIRRDAKSCPVLKAGLPLLRLLEHHPLKALTGGRCSVQGGNARTWKKPRRGGFTA